MNNRRLLAGDNRVVRLLAASAIEVETDIKSASESGDDNTQPPDAPGVNTTACMLVTAARLCLATHATQHATPRHWDQDPPQHWSHTKHT